MFRSDEGVDGIASPTAILHGGDLWTANALERFPSIGRLILREVLLASCEAGELLGGRRVLRITGIVAEQYLGQIVDAVAVGIFLRHELQSFRQRRL